MKRVAIVAGVLALVCIAAVRAQDCTAQSCIYLPAEQMGSGATVATPTPLSTACDDIDHQLIGAWLTSYTITPGELLAACAVPSTGTGVYVVVYQRSGITQTQIVPNPGNVAVIRIPIPTTQFGANELIKIDVLNGQSGNVQSDRRLAELYLMTR